jgi:endonuclease YncB( thermonuclease family)
MMAGKLGYFYNVTIVRIIDGDTFSGDLDLGFYITKRDTFRLHGIDTPETWRPKSESERAHGLLATDLVKQLLPVGKTVFCESLTSGKYGRNIVKVYLSEEDYKSGKTLSDILIENDMSKKDSYE